MHHKPSSALLLCLVLVAVASQLQACEKRCPVGTTLVGATCSPNNVQSDQAVAQAPVAGSDAPAAAGNTMGTAPTTSAAPATNTNAPVPMGAPTAGAKANAPARNSNNPAATPDGGAASPSDPAEAEPVAVCTDSELRCNPALPGELESCVTGQWASQPCAADEMCLDAADGARCVLPVEACVGREGQNVCTGAGEMLACMPGGEAMTIATCGDSALCKAGIAAGSCAQCVPGTHQCTGAQLETCDPEGQGFAAQDTCGSAPLCDPKAGRCSAPKCEADQYKCEGNALKRCNEDLTAFESVKQCGAGLCDQANGACRMCMPGMARCQAGARQECDAAGQGFAVAACADDKPVCFGSGMCVQCAAAKDCTPRACNTVSCGSQRCSYTPTPKSSRSCGYSDGQVIKFGMDASGASNADGKIYVIAGGAAFHIYTLEDLNANFGGLDGVTDAPNARACPTKPIRGINLQETDDARIGHIGADGAWHHIVHGEDFTNNCGGYGNTQKIPAGGLQRNGITIGDSI